jgi:hypothetical protein
MRHHIGTLLTSIFPQARCLNTHPKRGGCRLCNTLKDRYPEPREIRLTLISVGIPNDRFVLTSRLEWEFRPSRNANQH